MKKIITAGLVIILLLGIAGLAGATDMTARAFGMGGTFTGIADDLSSVIYNPAGLSQSDLLGLQCNVGVMTPDYHKIEDLLNVPDAINDDNIVEAYNNFPEGALLNGQALVGANLKSFGIAANLKTQFKTRKVGALASLDNITTTEGIINFSQKLMAPPLNLGALSYGFNLKMIRSDQLNYKFDEATLTTTTASGNGFGLDVGVLGKVTDFITIGAQVKNLLVNDYTLSGRVKKSTFDGFSWNEEVIDPSYTESVKPDRVMRVGTSLYIPVINATLAADIDNFPFLTDNGQEQVLHLGIEKNLFFNALSLRAGTFNSSEESRYYTFGLGLNLTKLHLDAAIGSDDQFQNSVSGVLSVNMKF